MYSVEISRVENNETSYNTIIDFYMQVPSLRYIYFELIL